jgi:hypothetical protein
MGCGVRLEKEERVYMLHSVLIQKGEILFTNMGQ